MLRFMLIILELVLIYMFLVPEVHMDKGVLQGEPRDCVET